MLRPLALCVQIKVDLWWTSFPVNLRLGGVIAVVEVLTRFKGITVRVVLREVYDSEVVFSRSPVTSRELFPS